MRKQIQLIVGTSLLLVSCVTTREPAGAPAASTPIDYRWAQVSITPENCTQNLTYVQYEVTRLDQQKINLKLSENDLREFEKQNFQFRQRTSALTAGLPVSCVLQMRKVYTDLRNLRDYVTEKIYEKTKSFSFQIANIENFPFQSGDVLLTRGSSFLSSTISQVSSNKNQYSHVAYVYVDANTRQAYTMESYPTKGARVYPMAEALKNDNMRILLLRPRDSQKAEKAAKFMYEKITGAINKKSVITYDYRYDEKDHNRLSCVEVLQEPYDLVFQEKIPALKSKIQINNKKILNSLGIQNGDFFVPGDLETDPRFQVVFEWTDYRQTVDQRMKDAIVRKMLQWTSEEQYQLQGSLKYLISKGMLSLRNTSAWDLFSQRFGMAGVPLEIPSEILVTMVKFNDIGRVMMDHLLIQDQQSLQKQQRHLTETEIESALENLRADDRENFVQGRSSSPLHLLFRPSSLQPSPTY